MKIAPGIDLSMFQMFSRACSDPPSYLWEAV